MTEDRDFDKTRKVKQDIIIRLLRMMGGACAALGVFMFFDVGGTASLLGMVGKMAQTLGGILMLVGILDVIAAPRVLSAVFEAQEKAEREARRKE